MIDIHKRISEIRHKMNDFTTSLTHFDILELIMEVKRLKNASQAQRDATGTQSD